MFNHVLFLENSDHNHINYAPFISKILYFWRLLIILYEKANL